MNRKFPGKPIALALGAGFALAGAAAPAGAQDSIFQAADLGTGYMVALAGEGHAHGEKRKDATCGAGAFDAMDKDKDGKLSREEFEAGHKAGEGGCGEGKCGGSHSSDKKKTDSDKKK